MRLASKLIHRAYSTYFYPPIPKLRTSKASKCKLKKPNLMHCIWNCPVITHFWDRILNYMHRISKIKLPIDPYLWSFNIFPDQPIITTGIRRDMGARPKDWIQICLLTAKRYMMRHWIDINSPTRKK